jgi:hypothetical protein
MGPPIPLCDQAPHVDPELERVVMKCIARDPYERFESADHLRDVLAGFLASVEATMPLRTLGVDAVEEEPTESFVDDGTTLLHRPFGRAPVTVAFLSGALVAGAWALGVVRPNSSNATGHLTEHVLAEASVAPASPASSSHPPEMRTAPTSEPWGLRGTAPAPIPPPARVNGRSIRAPSVPTQSSLPQDPSRDRDGNPTVLEP